MKRLGLYQVARSSTIPANFTLKPCDTRQNGSVVTLEKPMSDTAKKLSLWAHLAALVARLGGAIASSVLKSKESQKAADISGKIGDVNDAIGSALDDGNDQ